MKPSLIACSAARPWDWNGRAIMTGTMNKNGADAKALENGAFWERVAPIEKKLFNFLRKALNFSEDSADLFQEVVLRAWKYFPTYDRERDFSTWIFAIAHNEIKKHFRRRRGDRALLSLEQLASDPAAPAADPDVELVHGAARTLPARQREVFFLHYYNGFSVAETAAICGLRQGNVKFILNRGREAVRRALEVRHEK
jgi:RNA polymerase sigma factor (sigma-70 family)